MRNGSPLHFSPTWLSLLRSRFPRWLLFRLISTVLTTEQRYRKRCMEVFWPWFPSFRAPPCCSSSSPKQSSETSHSNANGAGILMRYFADFGPLLSLAACLSMMALLNNLSNLGSLVPGRQTQEPIASNAQTIIRRILIFTVLVSVLFQLIELSIFGI